MAHRIGVSDHCTAITGGPIAVIVSPTTAVESMSPTTVAESMSQTTAAESMSPTTILLESMTRIDISDHRITRIGDRIDAVESMSLINDHFFFLPNGHNFYCYIHRS